MLRAYSGKNRLRSQTKMRGVLGARPSDTASLALRLVTLFSVGLIDPLATPQNNNFGNG
jgi:hypothetical protein